METEIHDWMDQAASNYVSRADNTINEDRFLRACSAQFPTESGIAEIFWSWDGWHT